MSRSTLCALCREYAMDPQHVVSVEADPERITFTVFSVGPFGERPYLRGGEVAKHFVIKRVLP